MNESNEVQYDTILDEYETVPCGQCVTSKYYLKGELVRQDIKVVVDQDKIKFDIIGDASL